MTFHGHAKWEGDDHGHAESHGHDDHNHGHALEPHESPWTMLAPLLVLAVGATAAGGVFVEHFVGAARADFWRGALFALPSNHVLDQAATLPAWVVWGPLTVTAAGFFSAWYAYILHEGMGARIAARKGLLWTFLYNKWFFDELYQATFVRLTKLLGDLFWKQGDKRLIDGLGPDGVATVSGIVGRATGRAQTGYVYHYAFVMLLGIAGLLSFALWRFS